MPGSGHPLPRLAQRAQEAGIIGLAAGPCQRAGGVVRMLDGADYNAGIEKGYVLAAPDEDSWTRLRDRFAFLAE